MEDYKNEFKQCLKENIQYRIEINQLRKAKKEADQRNAELAKELEEAKKRDSLDTLKVVKRLELKNRKLTGKVHDLR